MRLENNCNENHYTFQQQKLSIEKHCFFKKLHYQQHKSSSEKYYFFKKAQWKSSRNSCPFLSFPYLLIFLCCSTILLSCILHPYLLPSCPLLRTSYMLQMRLFPSFWTNVGHGNPQQQQQNTSFKSWERSSQLKIFNYEDKNKLPCCKDTTTTNQNLWLIPNYSRMSNVFR